MDTDAIYSAVCSYGTEKHRRWESDAEDTLSDIKRLLNEADEEHKSLLAENERLVDEVAELIAERDALKEQMSEAVRLNVQGGSDPREMFNAGWCAAARFCDREDVVYDGLVGPGGCPAFEVAYRAADSRTSKQDLDSSLLPCPVPSLTAEEEKFLSGISSSEQFTLERVKNMYAGVVRLQGSK